MRGLCLLYCASARANYFLRTVRPEHSHAFALQHDAQVWRYFCTLLAVDLGAISFSAKVAATLPLRSGRIGLEERREVAIYAAHSGQLGGLDKHDC